MPSDKAVVIRLDPALDPLVSTDAKLDLVKNDFGFTEEVVWVAICWNAILLTR